MTIKQAFDGCTGNTSKQSQNDMISRSPNRKPNIVIYRDSLLPPSETFIRAQGEGISTYAPFHLGLTRVPGVELPSERTFTLSDGFPLGRVQEVIFKFTGYSHKMHKQFLGIGPSLIHAHFGFDGTTILPLVERLRLPLVVTYHGFDATLRPDYLLQSRWGRRYLAREDLLKRRCNQFIAVSQFIQSKLVERGFPEDKIVVHYIGLDTQAFMPVSAVQREPMVLFVGRLVEKKGCEFLIRAMQFVQESAPKTELVIVGDGPLRPSLERQAAATLRHFSFVGVQKPQQIRGWMGRATVFCVPSVVAESGDAEGFGIVFLESQAMGLPVVSFASGGIPEAVANGETGLLAPDRDWRALAENIHFLLTDQAAWKSMSRAGQERVRRDFDLRIQCAKLEQIYGETLVQPGINNNE